MNVSVTATADPSAVLDRAGAFLAGDPVRHNLMLTLLADRARTGEPGRYWIASTADGPVGVAFQSPLHFPITITPMPIVAASALAEAIAGANGAVPGVNGEVSAAASFAGQWTECRKAAATPHGGQRLYEIRDVVGSTGAAGAVRPAAETDRDLLVGWLEGFHADTGERGDAAGTVEKRLPAGHFWIWDDAGASSMAALSPAVAGTVRVQAVYTPPARRCRGYAGALVAALSETVLSRGERCVLYTDLANPTSNSVYRRIGYRAVSEILRYRFE
ncbi:MAG TPA: GNAT family N-acetyltransferase [Acidimicrobiales bacterium]|nr:GNAT family N-acetyltransferase [Acidimicrobiales bacterium]